MGWIEGELAKKLRVLGRGSTKPSPAAQASVLDGAVLVMDAANLLVIATQKSEVCREQHAVPSAPATSVTTYLIDWYKAWKFKDRNTLVIFVVDQKRFGLKEKVTRAERDKGKEEAEKLITAIRKKGDHNDLDLLEKQYKKLARVDADVIHHFLEWVKSEPRCVALGAWCEADPLLVSLSWQLGACKLDTRPVLIGSLDSDMLPFGATCPILMGLNMNGKSAATVKLGSTNSPTLDALTTFGYQVLASFSGCDFSPRLATIGGGSKGGCARALALTTEYVKGSDAERKELLRKLETEERWESEAVAERAAARVLSAGGGGKKKKKKKRKRKVGAAGFARGFERTLQVWRHYPTFMLTAPRGKSLLTSIFDGSFKVTLVPLTSLSPRRTTMASLFGDCCEMPHGGASGHVVQAMAKLQTWRGSV